MNSMINNSRTFLRLYSAVIAAFFISLRQIRLRSNYLRAVAVILVGLIPSMVSAQVTTTYHVDDDGPCGNGLTWGTAMCYLQDALAVANAGDTIKVAKGIYYPDECDACGVGGTDVQDAAFNIPLEVILEGGYVGYDEPDPDVRDPDLFDDTVLSGDIEQDDLSSNPPTPGNIVGDNSFHVVTIINVSNPDPQFDATHVDGFFITAGNADNPADDDDQGGGGAYIIDQDPPDFTSDPIREGPLFRNCIFQGNRAERAGGAIAAVDVGLEVRDCQILNNESDGGTIEGSPRNTVTQNGGGISGIAPMFIVNSILIKNNSTGLNAAAEGGGLNVTGFHADNPIAIASCFFASNEAQDDPGEIGYEGAGGGAVINAYQSDEVHVMNCLFVKNVAENDGVAGGGLNVTDGVQVTLSTFYENSAPNGYGGGLAFVNNPVNNCIAWNNTAESPALLWKRQLYGSGSDTCPTWSNIQDWDYPLCDGDTYNICADPEFVDPDGTDNILGNADDDFRLTEWSPSIEKGNDNLIPLDWGDVDDDGPTEPLPWDLAKETRVIDAGVDPGTDYYVDQGAYEYQCPACPWDLDHSGEVGTGDLLILFLEWGNRCTAADFVLPEGVSTGDQLALFNNWGPCNGCELGGSSGSEWDPQLVAAVQVMGFAGQAHYTDWALHDATDGQVFAATVVLAAILEH